MATDADARKKPPEWRPTWKPEAVLFHDAALRSIRSFFHERGYLEVNTPTLSRDVVVDAHLHPLTAVDPQTGETLFLQTSPEACMKRLLAAGSGSIFQIGPVFRAGERGDRHNPEFTMVEWYGVGTSDVQQMALTEQLVQTVHEALRQCPVKSSDSAWNLKTSLPAQFERLTYEAAFERLGLSSVLNMTTDQLRIECETRCGLHGDDIDRDELLNLLLAEKIEPHLGCPVPEFLHSYPISQAALAEVNSNDPRTARRFELYLDGLELCNGYHELTDADELHQRTQAENQRRTTHEATVLPGAPRLQAAMTSGLPACSGVALGFERLLMALLGTKRIEDVLAFPIERA